MNVKFDDKNKEVPTFKKRSIFNWTSVSILLVLIGIIISSYVLIEMQVLVGVQLTIVNTIVRVFEFTFEVLTWVL